MGTFAEEPVPFDELLGRTRRANLYGLEVPIAGLSDLIAMKRKAGRPQDLLDIAALERIALLSDRDDRD